MADRAAGVRFPREPILEYVVRELDYYQVLRRLGREQAAGNGGDTEPEVARARGLLVRAVNEQSVQVLECVFRVLGVIHGTRDMRQAFQGLRSANPTTVAHAIEFLDTVLSPRLKSVIVPVAEDIGSRGVRAETVTPGPDDGRLLARILNGRDRWLRVCGLHVIGAERLDAYRAEAGRWIDDGNPVVRETARYAAGRVSAAVGT
jgi:hypothetical protein